MTISTHVLDRELGKFREGADGKPVVAIGCAGSALLTDKTTTASTTYIGSASIGSLTSAAVWQIFKIADSSGDKTITWADSDNSFDNIWDNRASLSYG